MSNNFYSVDFLNINKSKKLYAWVHGLILGVFILNTTMAGVFMIAPPSLACLPPYEQECKSFGYDFAVAKWEWDGESTEYYKSGYDISVVKIGVDASWTANQDVAGVVKKSGQVSSDHNGGLNGEIEGDISHLTFCGNEEDPECILELIKTDNPDPVAPGGDLTYTLTLTNIGTAVCTGSGVRLEEHYDDITTFLSSDPDPEVGYDNLWVYNVLQPGESVVVEILTTVSTEAECASEIINEACTWAEQFGSVNDPDNWVCTEERTTVECPSNPGAISGYKWKDLSREGNWDDGEPIIKDWVIYIDENDNDELDKDQYGPIEPYSMTNQDGYYTFQNLVPGTYKVCEEMQAGWDNSTLLCSEIIVGEGQDVRHDFGNYEMTYCGDGIRQEPNDMLTGGPYDDGYEACDIDDNTPAGYVCTSECTLEEIPPGLGWLTVCKYEDADGLDSTTGDRTLITDTAWTFTVGLVSRDTVNGCTDFIGLEAGDYTITETQQTDWTPVDPASGELTVSLGVEEHKTVNFANYKEEATSTLIVKKIVDGGEAIPANWTMHINDDLYEFPGSESGTATEVDAGMYQVTETGTPDNYLLTYSENCPDGNIDVAAGETATCILTNTYHIPPPQIGHLIVYKYVVGGEATSSDWTMHVGDSVQFPGTAAGEDRGYDPGTYAIHESGGPANYILTFDGDCNATGSVEVIAGETKECFLTNTYDPPPAPYCGDGHLDPGEQCDDGNNVSGDGCSATCTTEGGGGGGGGYIYLQILDLEAHCLTADSAIVNWRTNKTATSWVVYGIDSDDISDATSTEVTSASTNHSVIIDGLTPEVDYSFEAVSRQGSREVKKTVTYNTNACVITEGEEGEPILTIVKSIDKEFVNPGDTGLEYTVIVTNIGNLTSFDTVLVDALPTGLTFADNGENTKTWELGDMAPNESKEITYLVNVSVDAAPMAYINTAKVSSSNHEEISDIADVDIRIVEVLAITGFDLSELISLVMVITMLFGMGWFVRQGLREEKN
ncbi:DUF11 domain-containing protein [Candidatus Parcubacteria bacterium]|nr:DUF11 domain-containing protein [Candidatus Parcubacteria bacterium]